MSVTSRVNSDETLVDTSPSRPVEDGEKVERHRGGDEAQPSRVDEDCKKISWKQLTILLIIEAIALGTLTMPRAFAVLGMIPGITLTVVLGLIAIYTSYLVGQVKIKHPWITSYPDAVGLFWGRTGFWVTVAMFISFLVLIVGSHVLTGNIAFIHIARGFRVCALGWSALVILLLFGLTLPPTFKDFAWLGYVDFWSILAAILFTMIGAGILTHNTPGGFGAVDWNLWPAEDVSFYQIVLAITNIAFAFSFTVCQYSLMSDMHTPKDYMKSIWALGIMEIVIYATTGAVLYAFVGSDVRSPALLSTNSTYTLVAFVLALPVIFISGSINSNVVGRYIMDRAFANSEIRLIKSRRAWLIWITLIAAITIVAWAIAEAIAFFDALLGLISSLLVSGFSFYLPALFWFYLLKERHWFEGWRNIMLSILHACIALLGAAICIIGCYASGYEIYAQYQAGSVRMPFTCNSTAYL